MQLSTNVARMALIPLAIGVAVAGTGALAPSTAHAEASSETLSALSDAQSRYEAACTQLNDLYQQVYIAQGAYETTCSQLDQTNAAITALQEQIAQEKVELEEAQNVLAERLAANYRAGESSMIDVIFSATSFEDLVSRIYYAGKVSDSDAEAIQNVKDIKAELEANEASLQEQRTQQEELQTQQAAELEEVQSQTQACQDYVNSLDSEVQALYAQAQAEAQAAAEAAAAAAAATASQNASAYQEQANEAISAAEEAGYYYNEDTGGWTDSSGSYVSSDTVSSVTGYDVSSIIARAQSYIGTSYNLGSDGSDGYIDCSGLTSAAYGGTIPHYSYDQYQNSLANGTFTSDLSSLQPGDCVYYSYDGGATTYHVALYIGNGQVIDAIPNGGVQVRDVNYCDGAIGGGNPS